MDNFLTSFDEAIKRAKYDLEELDYQLYLQQISLRQTRKELLELREIILNEEEEDD